jgi:hypothetical protein
MNINRVKTLLLPLAALLLLAPPGCGLYRPARTYHPLRPITKDDLCIGVSVYAQPDVGYHVGELVVLRPIDYGSEEVPAINISVLIDGGMRSLWRREEEVMYWYVPADTNNCPKPGEKDYRGTFFDEPKTKWGISDVEFSPDEKLWLRRDGRGWSSTEGRHTTGFRI